MCNAGFTDKKCAEFTHHTTNGKIQKALKDGILTFCPILSAVGMPTYKLAKFCDNLLKPITTNEYTIKDSFSFAKKVAEFDPNLIMASFDVKCLYVLF